METYHWVIDLKVENILTDINISSQIDGQTQTDWPIDQEESFFNHLIDIHYGTRGIQVKNIQILSKTDDNMNLLMFRDGLK